MKTKPVSRDPFDTGPRSASAGFEAIAAAPALAKAPQAMASEASINKFLPRGTIKQYGGFHKWGVPQNG